MKQPSPFGATISTSNTDLVIPQHAALLKPGMQVVSIAMFAVLTGIAAQIKYPVPGSAVPVTLQTLPVVLAGMVLGGRLALASMALYLALGIAGYQVFALNLGVGEIIGPTGGYLLGFVLVQPVIAAVVKMNRGWTGLIVAGLIGHAVILLSGAAWVAVLTGSITSAIVMGVLPFLLGSVIKGLAAAAIARPWTHRPHKAGAAD